MAIVGQPNVGKSSLFNALARHGPRDRDGRSPGTTRDLVTETADSTGIAVTLVDTAGVRETRGRSWRAKGVARARQAVADADLLLVVLDRCEPLDGRGRAAARRDGRRRRG